jgi:hypothetical protein
MFGHPVRPESVHADLERVLMDRALASFPLAEPGGSSPPVVREPFLDAWDGAALTVACPPTLAQLQGGVAAVNRILRQTRHRGDVGLPNLAHRPVAVHGGILHPGEPLPRSVPDLRSLRLRALMHAPYLAALAALMWLHRHHPDAVRVSEERVGWRVMMRGVSLGDPLAVVDGFAADRGWVVARRLEGGLDCATVVRVLEVLGIAVHVQRLLVLEERFFHHLSSEPEEQEVGARLQPLANALQAWLEAAHQEAA